MRSDPMVVRFFVPDAARDAIVQEMRTQHPGETIDHAAIEQWLAGAMCGLLERVLGPTAADQFRQLNRIDARRPS